jgi:hypothetical protein
MFYATADDLRAQVRAQLSRLRSTSEYEPSVFERALASVTSAKTSALSSSSPSLEWKLSAYPFSHGDPGAMYRVSRPSGPPAAGSSRR